MSQSGFVLSAMMLAFVLFITAKGTLPIYLASVGL